MEKQALIFGATGAVGTQLLALCLEDNRYSRVSVIARGAANVQHPKLDWIEAELDTLQGLAPLPGLNGGDAYCCLGTTIKAAGSEAAFRRVDHDFVVNAASFAMRCEVTHFSLITSLGANSHSSVLYSRTKGDVEEAIIAKGFPSLHIFRPSLLTGERGEFRLKEEIGKYAMLLATPLFHLGLRKFKPVDIPRLARAMHVSAHSERMTGSPRFFESDEIQHY